MKSDRGPDTATSSIASGSSSMSWPAGPVGAAGAASSSAVPKSGSSSGGGTSTTGLRRGGSAAGGGDGAAPGRFGTTGLRFVGCGARGVGARGVTTFGGGAGGAAPGRLGTTGATRPPADGATAFGGSISMSSASSGSGSLSSVAVGSNSAGGGMSSGLISSCSGSTSPAARRTSPNSALVVSNPSSMPAAPAGSSPSPRLVDSISRDVSDSAVTGSTRLSEIGAGSGGGGEGRGAVFGGGTGLETGAPRPAPTPGRSLTVGGESTSRNTRLDVLRLPDFERSGAPDAGGLALGAGE